MSSEFEEECLVRHCRKRKSMDINQREAIILDSPMQPYVAILLTAFFIGILLCCIFFAIASKLDQLKKGSSLTESTSLSNSHPQINISEISTSYHRKIDEMHSLENIPNKQRTLFIQQRQFETRKNINSNEIILQTIKVSDPKLSSHPSQNSPRSRSAPAPEDYRIPSGSISPSLITAAQRTQASRFRALREPSPPQALIMEEYHYFNSKYKIDNYDELCFCIVVPSYNNEPNNRYLRNLNSIFVQVYTNFHVVYINDASTDNTSRLVKEYAQKRQIPKEKFLIIDNAQRMLPSRNLPRAARQFCQPDQIFLIVDGDDQLLGRQVLKVVNSQFQQNKAWFFYSNFIFNGATAGYSRPPNPNVVESNGYRKAPYFTSHLRAFYTQLVRLIKDSDMHDSKGNYLSSANDIAICLPALEMSHRRIVYLPELLYFYNHNTGFNNHRVRLKEQRQNNMFVRTHAPYQELKELLPGVQFPTPKPIRTRQPGLDYNISSFLNEAHNYTLPPPGKSPAELGINYSPLRL